MGEAAPWNTGIPYKCCFVSWLLYCQSISLLMSLAQPQMTQVLGPLPLIREAWKKFLAQLRTSPDLAMAAICEVNRWMEEI